MAWHDLVMSLPAGSASTAIPQADAAPLVTLEDVQKARTLLEGVVHTTPLEESAALTAKLGGPVYFKCENLQRAGSFKVRGAYVRLARLSPEERARGVVAASAGNHAQGVALAAGVLNIESTVYMPQTAPLPKVTATRSYGAKVELVGDSVDEALVAAAEHAERTGAVFVHPFDHRDVIAGQGSLALEIMEQCPEVKTVVAAVGGGGLLSGILAAVKGISPETKVIGVQAEGAAAFPPSLMAGHPVALPQLSTIADGIAVGHPGELTFSHISQLADGVTTVSEEDLSRALLFCLERSKLVVEPAGAVGVAALLADPHKFEPPVVAVLSGGNMDPLLMLRVIEHGMASAGRYLHFSVRAVDRPGSLAALLGKIAAEGVNVLDVEHFRHNSRLPLGATEIFLSVETKGSEHSERLLTALRAAGYPVTPL